MRLVLSAGAVDLQAGVIETPQGPLALSETEQRVLRYLAQQGGRVVSREELLERVWGYAPGVRSRTVDTTMQRLRAKVEADPAQPACLHTVRGEGYRLQPVAEPQLPPIPRLEQLVGRQEELARLDALLLPGARITLTGPSGVGKTWLARRALTAIADGGRRLPWFASLEGARTGRDLLHALAGALQLGPGEGEPAVQIARWLTRGPSVGVLDDLQELEPEALALLSSILRRVPDLAVLSTSQRLLGLEGERRLELQPLPPAQSVELLRERLAALGLPLPAEETLAALAERAEGLPLALELLCPLLEVLPASRLLALPDLLALQADRPDLPPRHRSLGAAVQASLDLLPAPALQVLSQLAVFAGPFSLEAAEAVLLVPSDVEATQQMATLARRSLLRRQPDGRMALSGPVRARLRAQAAPQRLLAARDRLAGWLAGWWPEIEGRRQPLSAVVSYRADLQEGLERAPAGEVLALAKLLSLITGQLGPVEALPEVYARALSRSLPDEVRVVLLQLLAEAHAMASAPAEAERVAAEGLALALRLGSDLHAAGLYRELGRAASEQGRHDEAIRHGHEALARAEALGVPQMRYVTLSFLGTLHSAARRPELSYALHERAAQLARESGSSLHEAIALMNMACSLDDSDRSIALMHEALALARGRGHPRFEGVVWGNLGSRLDDLDRLEESEQAYAQSTELLTGVGDLALVWTFEVRRAAVLSRQGQREQAVSLLRQARDALTQRRPLDAARASVYLATLTGDLPSLREAASVDPVAACALALIEGSPPPPEIDARELRALQALVATL